MQIFTDLGEEANVAGSILAEALSSFGIPLKEPLTDLVNAVQDITKTRDQIAVLSSRDVQFVLNETQVRFKKELRFTVAQLNGLPVLSNIVGVSVHEVFWLDIQSLQLKEARGQKVLHVVTSAATRDITLN
jgi:hypothetical protein